MKFKELILTNHAKERWIERVRLPEYEIYESLKRARIIKNNELLPFGTTRVKGTTYALDEKLKILFYLEDKSINEYRVVTLISEQSTWISKTSLESVLSRTRPVNVEEEIEETEEDITPFINGKTLEEMEKYRNRLNSIRSYFETKIKEHKKYVFCRDEKKHTPCKKRLQYAKILTNIQKQIKSVKTKMKICFGIDDNYFMSKKLKEFWCKNERVE